MTGAFIKVGEIKLRRIKELTAEGLSSRVIADRLGISREQVYYYQKEHGLRKVINRESE